MTRRFIVPGVLAAALAAGSLPASAKPARCFTTDDGYFSCDFKGLDRQGSFEITARGYPVYTLWVDVARDGRTVGTYGPQIRFPQQLRQQNQTTQHVSILHEPLKDVFLSFSGVDQANNATLTIKFFPLQSWVWAGFIITILGSGLASWPKRQRAA